MTTARVVLIVEDALAMLPDPPDATTDEDGEITPDVIHTFRSAPNNMLVGADWPREKLVALIRTGKPELAGEIATGMGHGLVVWDETGPLFIQTRKAGA